jgi:Flp pilus assembly protein TadB
LCHLPASGSGDSQNHSNAKKLKRPKMKKNVGNADRLVRVLAAAIIATLYLTNVISGTVGLVLLVLAGIFVATSLISFCPLYAIFGLSTCPVKQNAK